jgi:hypothetical protein
MGKKSSSAPAAPDPDATAKAESQYNRLDTYGPSGGGVRHGYTDPETGAFVQGVTPDGMKAQAAQTYQESPIERRMRQMLEPASLDLTQRVITDNIEGMPDAARVKGRQGVARDIFDRSFSLMAPAIDKANERLITNLQARGLPVGGEAFNDAYGEQVAQTQDTISRLAQDANVAAGQEQSRQFGLDQAQRSSAISELVAAMGGGYNPPSNTPTGSASPVNYSGLVSQQYNAQMGQYNQNQANKMAGATAIGQLGTALLKCTVEAKHVEGPLRNQWAADILSDIPLFVWRYLEGEGPGGETDRHIGPMAEHFAARTGLGDGRAISAIDYFGLLAGALQNALQRVDILERRLAGQRLV